MTPKTRIPIQRESHGFASCLNLLDDFVQSETGLETENIEILKKTYDDFEKRQGENSDGVPVESLGLILSVVGIRCKYRPGARIYRCRC